MTETPSEYPPALDTVTEDVNKKNNLLIKILSVLFILVIFVLSVIVFLNREKLQQTGNFSLLGIFALCFISNASILAPAPGLIVVVTGAAFLHPLLVSLTGALGSTLGELTGYFSGRAGKNLGKLNAGKMSGIVQKYGSPAVFLFALIPLPLFDIIGITCGYFGIKWYKFIIACFSGKFLKMIFYAYGSVYFQNLLESINIF